MKKKQTNKQTNNFYCVFYKLKKNLLTISMHLFLTNERFHGVVGYHMCFTYTGSPVRTRVEPFLYIIPYRNIEQPSKTHPYNTSTKKKRFILNHPYHQNIKQQIYHFLLLHSTYHFYDYPVSYYSIYILNIMNFISHFIFMFSTFITLTFSILDPLNVIFALSTISKYILKSKLINK